MSLSDMDLLNVEGGDATAHYCPLIKDISLEGPDTVQGSEADRT